MKLHQLTNTCQRPNCKRIGRGDGSGWGTTAGRGYKGSGQRAGYASRPHFEGGQIPLFRRLPKRGFKNPKHAFYTLINIHTIETNFEAGETVDIQVLFDRGLVNVKPCDCGLKILGNGELTKKVTVIADKFSASAQSKIEAVGGTCQIAEY